MSHFDKVTQLPHGFDVIASTDNTPIAGIANEEKKLYGFMYKASKDGKLESKEFSKYYDLIWRDLDVHI